MAEGQPKRLSAKDLFKRVTGIEAYQQGIQKGKTKVGAFMDGALSFTFPILGENFRRLSLSHEGKVNYIFGDSWAGVSLQMLLDIGFTVGTVSMALNGMVGEGAAIKLVYNTVAISGSERVQPLRTQLQ